MNRKILVLSLLFVIIITILSYKYWDISIDKSYHCIQFDIGSDIYKPVMVEIQGKIKKSILREDIANVSITIDDYRIPDTSKYKHIFPMTTKPSFFEELWFGSKPKYIDTIDSYIYTFNQFYTINLSYMNYNQGSSFTEYVSFGSLFYKDDFEDIFIAVNAKSDDGSSYWYLEEGYTLIVSADTIDEAKNLASENLGWDLDIN